jgi:hypothetical protein
VVVETIGSYSVDVTADAPRPVFRLVLAPRPVAEVKLYSTIPPELNAGVKVEKYATRFGHGWEKHTDARGIVTWWKLIAPGYRWEWQSMTWKPLHASPPKPGQGVGG